MQASLVKCAEFVEISFVRSVLFFVFGCFCPNGTRYNTPILISTTGAAKGKKDKDSTNFVFTDLVQQW